MRARLSRFAPEEIAVIPLLLLGAISLLLQPAALGRLVPTAPANAPPSVGVLEPVMPEVTDVFDRTGEVVPLPLRIESMRARVIRTIPEFGGRRTPPAAAPVLQPRIVEH